MAKKEKKTEETKVETPVEQYDAEGTKKFLDERQKNLTPEEREQMEATQKRFEALSTKGRVAKVRGIVETPQVILEKMVNGIRELARLPVEPLILDGALSVQSERFRELSAFFDIRQRHVANGRNLEFSKRFADFSQRVEELRLELLSTGNKALLERLAGDVEAMRTDVLDLWKKEDAEGGSNLDG